MLLRRRFPAATATAGAETLTHGFDNSGGTVSGADAEATTAAPRVKVRSDRHHPCAPLRDAAAGHVRRGQRAPGP